MLSKVNRLIRRTAQSLAACEASLQKLNVEKEKLVEKERLYDMQLKNLQSLLDMKELLGEVVTDSTKKNLEMRVDAENGATAGKFDLAKRAKAANLDAIHDTVHEMARDEARHGKAFEGLLKRYFG